MSVAKRSLRASSSGIQQAKRAFARKGWTQENLASEVNLKTRQPIWRFFTGRPIERHTFMEICSLLDLNWLEIAQDPPAEIVEKTYDFSGLAGNADPNVLAQQIRSKRHDQIQHQCAYLTLFDLNYPVNIGEVYIDVDLVEQIGNFPLNTAQLQTQTPEEFERWKLTNIFQKKISGIEALKTFSKLRILGEPGTGKTVFLKHLAMLCNRGEFAPNLVPVFINLRDFADESGEANNFNLFNYIHREFLAAEVHNPAALINLLHGGRIFLLLDGLDEVSPSDFPNVVQEIRRFSDKYYNNQILVTCRTAAKEFKIKGFTDVEIAALTEEKISQLAQKWLLVLNKSNSGGAFKRAVQFCESLNLPENLQFRQLVVRPLFLYVACLMFSRSEEFFLKFGDFSKLCLDSLLGKWDQSKSLKRDEIYPGFSRVQTLKFFRRVASDSFDEGGKYFLSKKRLLQYMINELQNLPNSPKATPEQLQVDAETVLKALELLHGVLVERVPGSFSFSFSAFQDYFIAEQIADRYHLQNSDRGLQNLVDDIGKPKQNQILLLTASLLERADILVELLKEYIQKIRSENLYLQEFLPFVHSDNLGDLSGMEIEKYQCIPPNFNLNGEQQQALQKYYQAYQLLLGCLRGDCVVTESLRREIEVSFLLHPSKVCANERTA